MDSGHMYHWLVFLEKVFLVAFFIIIFAWVCNGYRLCYFLKIYFGFIFRCEFESFLCDERTAEADILHSGIFVKCWCFPGKHLMYTNYLLVGFYTMYGKLKPYDKTKQKRANANPSQLHTSLINAHRPYRNYNKLLVVLNSRVESCIYTNAIAVRWQKWHMK